MRLFDMVKGMAQILVPTPSRLERFISENICVVRSEQQPALLFSQATFLIQEKIL